ncbi:MAG: Gfo/Idh/MocA family oxidoreductase [Candidatus Berkelbacteria bacterium]
MDKINVAVIGVGNMGQHHARVYSELPNVNLVAVCDMDLERSSKLAKSHDCLAYDDYEKMLKENKIDIVSVVVPTFLHHKVACAVLALGSNVFLEKPIAVSLKEGKEIIATAKKNGKKLMIGHIERFNPAIQRLKELIEEGRIGNIISINIKRAGGLPPQIKNANVVIDLGIHDIDIANFLVSDFPTEVYGFKSKNLIDEQEDSAVILLKYKNSSAFIEVNWVTPVKVRTLDITGTKAFARVDYINQTIVLYENSYMHKPSRSYKDFDEFIAKFSATDEVKVGINKAEPLKCELESFVAAVANDTIPLVTGEEGYKALEVCLKI